MVRPIRSGALARLLGALVDVLNEARNLTRLGGGGKPIGDKRCYRTVRRTHLRPWCGVKNTQSPAMLRRGLDRKHLSK